jgi:hypothetical protein
MAHFQYMETIAGRYSEVTFWVIDLYKFELEPLWEKFEDDMITPYARLPFFVCFRNGKVYDKLSGTDQKSLETMIKHQIIRDKDCQFDPSLEGVEDDERHSRMAQHAANYNRKV